MNLLPQPGGGMRGLGKAGRETQRRVRTMLPTFLRYFFSFC